MRRDEISGPRHAYLLLFGTYIVIDLISCVELVMICTIQHLSQTHKDGSILRLLDVNLSLPR